MNGQFESVCESVFSEVESQAMDALDLPGCFRTRSHSYLRAIQAGYSQDDECIPAMTPSNMASTIRSTAGKDRTFEVSGGKTPRCRVCRNWERSTPSPEVSHSQPLVTRHQTMCITVTVAIVTGSIYLPDNVFFLLRVEIC